MEFPEILGIYLFGLFGLKVLILLDVRGFSEKAG